MSWEQDWLCKRAQLTPWNIAIIDGSTKERWTYQELNERAERLAGMLQQRGIKKGDRIALLSPNHISYFDLLFAATKLGAIFVPLNWRLSSTELAYIFSDCEPSLVFVDEIFISLVDGGVPSVQLNQEYKEWIAKAAPCKKEEISDSDPLLLIYTGGTTGLPKGVVLTHQSVFFNMINTITSWGLTSDDKTITSLPMFHTGGLNALSLPILHIGGTVILSDQFDGEKTIQLIEEFQCTVILLVPTMYHLLIKAPSFKEATFRSVHTFLSGGAPCSYVIYKAFQKKGLAFKEGYGLTEAGPNNFFIDPSEAVSKRGSVGKPMLYNEVKIIKENGEEADHDEVGEICIRGLHVFDSYWQKPEITTNTVINGWLHTGDLGRRDKEGYFYIVGRKKDMIITGGENVYPLEVEHVLNEHPAVSEVAVVGLADEKWGEVVSAFIVVKKNFTLSEEELLAHCQRTLGRYKIPKRITFVEELPKTPVGKVDKKKLFTEAV
ncbi:long-chain fatty acid--CoA ligase [Alkalihalophilus pseudofirmus]|uniref:acyl-CoA synthetase n=1 Tax=Alkalihalophilus pseudofirmus TaxID=79885 RepID=UPI00259BAD9C|nr:long-chain fatty acid--CoA ligase [Alkalihalophilus pseudofirmus]WEG16279.1 long-chain fatty acid--CoA ligase [Alkalihalophilus pseudofirmus]